MTFYLQQGFAIFMYLLLFVVLFFILRFLVHKMDKARLKRDFTKLHKNQERDRIDEERGREERRKLREKENS